MKILAILESKQKRLRAYLPEFMSPFMACMTRHCTVHDVPSLGNTETYQCSYAVSKGTTARCNLVDTMRDDADIYMLVRTDIIDATGMDNVPKDKDNYLVLSFSIRTLFSLYGRKQITTSTTWESLLNSYTQTQLLQAYVNLPIPATVVDLHGRSTTGLATCDPVNGEINWTYSDGLTYLDFGQAFKRPQAYSLDNVPGLTAHFTSKDWPEIEDKQHFLVRAEDILIEKDLSCNIQLENCITVINGLLYRCELIGDKLYVPGALDLFKNQSFPYSSVMLLDFTEMLSQDFAIQQIPFTDCTVESVTHNGTDWEVIFKLPESYSVSGTTPFISFDGRLIQFNRMNQIGDNTFFFVLSDREIQYMKERDMQLTEQVNFNIKHIKLRDNTETWIRAQFNDIDTSVLTEIQNELSNTNLRWDTLTDAEKQLLIIGKVLEPDGANYHRSFLFTVPNTGIYVHEYTVNTRLNYNGLLVHGNVEGILQSTRGQEIFEHVISSYLNMRTLSPLAWYTWQNGSDLLYTRDVNPAVGDAAYTSRIYVEDQCTLANAVFQFDADGNRDVIEEEDDTAVVSYEITALTKESDTSDTVTSITVDGVVYTKITSNLSRLLYGSDAHLLGYKPYEFLTTLEKHDTELDTPDITLLSTPYVDRMAELAVAKNSNEFRLLDIVSLT